jgi:hypothetical protein
MNRFADWLGVKIPIIQAPTGRIAGAERSVRWV